MTNDELDILQRIAESATSGEWQWNTYNQIQAVEQLRVYGLQEDELPDDQLPEVTVAWVPASYGDTATGQAASDAAYIETFDPPTILRLIEAARERSMVTTEP